jgi:hypothetical protein
VSAILHVWNVRPSNPGHVSLDIGAVYISYWPGEAAGKSDFKVGSTHAPSFPRSYAVDRRLERREADAHISVPGLDEARVTAAWEQFRAAAVGYNMMRQNCSTVVASLLQLGSGVPPSFSPSIRIDDHVQGSFERLLLRLRFFGTQIPMWTPDAVQRYALELVARAER